VGWALHFDVAHTAIPVVLGYCVEPAAKDVAGVGTVLATLLPVAQEHKICILSTLTHHADLFMLLLFLILLLLRACVCKYV
jgi:hypothetical protein